MARRCLLLLLLGMLGVSLGFQLRVPPALQSKILRARRGYSSKPVSSSSTTEKGEAPTDQGRGDSTNEGHLNWGKQWYPVLPEKTTDPGRVHAVQLLGKDLVLWRDTEGTWATFDDRCPHRAAPLTEGRVEKDGSLLCTYHGWRFDSEGKCLKIPQSENGGKDELKAAACAKVYPTQVVQGLVWVWGENGRDAALESALTPAAIVPELNDVEALKSGRVIAFPFYMRDLPYGWDTFLENVVDPSHVVIAHHGLVGNRDMAAPVRFEQHTLHQDGFSSDYSSPIVGEEADGAMKFVGTVVGGSLEFCAPSLVIVNSKVEDGNLMKLCLYGVPIRPGWCRVLSCQMIVAPKDAKKKNILGIPFRFRPNPNHIPDWPQHLVGHTFFDQDMALLHHQEQILATGGYNSANYKQGVFTPTGSDRGVLSTRKWMSRYTPDGPVWGGGYDAGVPPPRLNREELFDIYKQHTKTCTTCLGALKRVNQLRWVAKASAVASFGWAVLKGARAVGTSASPSASILNYVTARAMLPGLSIMFVSLGSIKVLESLHKSFHTGGHDHQDHD